MTYTLITNNNDLKTACQTLSQHTVIAVDTEFKRESTYFPIPCLFQLASADDTYCIDPFEIDDLSPLKEILGNEEILKIFHAGRQDLEIFYYLFEQLPKPIFDTQIAAAILGFPAQVGYAKLVSDYLGVELDKTLTRADWEKRPLPEKQLEYAANDVIYLLHVFRKVVNALEDSGRLNWPDADCDALLNESLYKVEPDTAWEKIRNFSNFSGNERCIAAAIAKWRESQAIKKNRPRKYIFDNAVITELSIKQPKSAEELQNLSDIPAFVSRKYGSQLLDIIKHTNNCDIPDEQTDYKRLSDAETAMLKEMQKMVKQAATQEEIEPTVICSKKEIEKLIRGKTNLNILRGWRYDLIGKQLESLLEKN